MDHGNSEMGCRLKEPGKRCQALQSRLAEACLGKGFERGIAGREPLEIVLKPASEAYIPFPYLKQVQHYDRFMTFGTQLFLGVDDRLS